MADIDENFSPESLGGFRDESEKRLFEALKASPNLDYDPEDDEMTEEQYTAMIERKRRIAERREAGRNKRAQEAMAKAAKEAKRSGARVPAATKPARGAEQAAAASVVKKAKSESAEKPVRRAPKKTLQEKRGRNMFYICLGAYALVLIILAASFLRYTTKCLKRYEDSRYENVIDSLVKKDFAMKVKDGSILDMVELPEHACVFESEDLYRKTYLGILQSSESFTASKDKNSYDTEHPVYDILSSDGNLVAKIRLKAVNEKTIFAMLRIGDWKIDKVVPSLSITTNNYRISVPDTYKVSVNGIAVTKDFMKGDPVPAKVEVPKEVLQYVKIPSTITYEITGLAEKPDILIYNSMGALVEFEPDANGNIRIEAMMGASETAMPSDRHDYALETAQMWTDFLTRDLKGSNYGLATIRKRLIYNSAYYTEAGHYATDVDITFISDHKDGKPKYTNVSVTDYKEYSDECYSCRIQFTKNMILNKTGQARTVTVDTTNYYVYIDDTPDDGVINPHWCVASMLTTTKNSWEEEDGE